MNELAQFPSLAVSVARISDLESSFCDCFLEMIKRDGNIYTFDFFLAGICDRAVSTSKAFRELIGSRNYAVSTVLLRAQIDTLFRAYGMTLTNNPLESCEKIFRGIRFDSLVDREGKKLKDFYLKEKIGKVHNWIPAVYENASGFVHMSEKNIFATFDRVGEVNEVGLRIGRGGSHLPDEVFGELAAAFAHISKICFETTGVLSYCRPGVNRT